MLIRKRLSIGVGAGLLLLVLALFVLGLVGSYSPSGWAQLFAVSLVAFGLVVAPFRARVRVVTWTGAALLAAVIALRLAYVGSGASTMITLDREGHALGTRWLGRVFDEQDMSLVGARQVLATWDLPDSERAQLVPSMQRAFVAMRASDGATPTPALDTIFGRQGPAAFDAVVLPSRKADPTTAVIFLHGYGGNFTLECWLMAEAARTVDALTICPSTRFAGDWWREDGERTLHGTLAYLKARGITRVYLAGLSYGAISATELASQFAPDLAGMILVAGASPTGSTGGLPTLVVQGEDDRNVPATMTRDFAIRTGATYRGFAGGHFVMMVEREPVRATIAAWLRDVDKQKNK